MKNFNEMFWVIILIKYTLCSQYSSINEIDVILIYTTGINRDGTGNKKYDNFQDNWLVIDNSIYQKNTQDLEDFIDRMADIPLGNTVNRQQKIFRGKLNKETQGFLTFISIDSRQNSPKAFLQIPDIIAREFGGKYKVNLKFLFDDL